MQKLSVVVSFLCCSFAVLGQHPGAPLPKSSHGFIVISHRANHEQVPENTLEAIDEAIRVGADYAELDLRTTRDSALVLSHDGTVDRMTDGKGNVKDLTLAEIGKLRVKATAATDNKIYRIPQFMDVLKRCKGRINIYLDFKDADPGETYRQIKEAGMEKQVVVYLNRTSQYRPWRKIAPAMPLMASVPEDIRTPEQLAALFDQVSIEAVDNLRDSAMIAVARRYGVAVWPDGQGGDEGPGSWSIMLSKHVQGMQTDHPSGFINWLNSNGLRDGLSVQAGTGQGVTGASGSGIAASGPAAVPAYRSMHDIAYSRNDPANVMDAYIPEDYDNARVLVYIHGGGWTGGDKAEFPKALLDELVGRDKYIVVSMNYRLVKDGRNIFPAQIEDIRTLLDFLGENAKKYHYSGNEYALMGGSAGAHLAMLYAYGYDSARQIKTVIDCWGPTDLADKAIRAGNKDANAKVANLLGVADPNAAICRDASPFYRLTATSGVPTILFHGGEDPLVHYSQAEKLYQKLLSLGIPAQYHFYPHEKHGVGPASAVDVMNNIVQWLKQYFNPQTPHS